MNIYKLYNSVSRGMMEKDIYIKDIKKALVLFHHNIDKLKKDREYLSEKKFNLVVNDFKNEIKDIEQCAVEILKIKNPYIIYKINNSYYAIIYSIYRDEIYNDETYEECIKVTLEEIEATNSCKKSNNI